MTNTQISRIRNSNIELFRILTMLLIVAHHYVVNSGLSKCINDGPLCMDGIFYSIFGAWGKTGINCFVLITGYYMCKSQINLHRFLKLLTSVLFYKIAITAIFFACGYIPIGLVKTITECIPMISVGNDFVSCFLMFYLCIPFLNILIHNLSQRQHKLLLILLLFIYTVHGSVPGLTVDMNYVSWFSVLYFISSYLRLYPSHRDKDLKYWTFLTLFSWFASIVSIIIFLRYPIVSKYYLLSDSNAILALTNAITAFMLFRNLNIKNSKTINLIAASSFGVLLIHANSSTMRQWLWKDTIDCVGHFSTSWLYPIACVLAIYTICTVIDIIRIKTLETPLLNTTERFCIRSWKFIQNKITIK